MRIDGALRQFVSKAGSATPELAFLAGTAAGSPSGRPQPIAGVETAVLTPTKFYEPPRQGLRSGRWSD